MRLMWTLDRFELNLNADDTYDWANRPGAAWPCSALAGHSLDVYFDTNGLLDYSVNGEDGSSYDIGADEFNALVADSVRYDLPKDHPCYFVAVGQYDAE